MKGAFLGREALAAPSYTEFTVDMLRKRRHSVRLLEIE